MVIDFHVHGGKPEHWDPSVAEDLRDLYPAVSEALNLTYPPEKLLSILKSQGVDRAVILAEMAPLTTGMITNQWVYQAYGSFPELILFASINPFLVRDLGAEVEHWVLDCGFRGIKLHPTYNHFYPQEARMYPLYEKAAQLGVPVVFHTGMSMFRASRIKYGNPLLYDDIAADLPELTIVLAHSGRSIWYEEAQLMASTRPNIFLDITGLPPRNLMQYLPRLERLVDKVIFGSDFPVIQNIGANIAAVRSLPLPAGAADKILGGNAARLLRLDIKAPLHGDGVG
jgi:predicted TIM-barrel fold metal-dependent hydrolase